MAEAFEAEIRIKGVDEAARELRELENRIEGVGDGMGEASTASSNFAQNVTATVVAAQAAYNVMSKLAEAVGAAADEFERQAGILNRFNGNITEAANRTNGLISNLDLMSASARASAGGLELTASQFATISVRASEFAAATGGDATEALNQMIQALAQGPDALKAMGVSVEGVTGLANQQRVAIAQLTEGYEDAESAADTLGGRLAVLSTDFDNLQTELIQVVNDSRLVESAWDNLTTATQTLFGELEFFGASDGPVSHIEAFVISGLAAINAFTQQVEATATAITAFFDLVSDPSNDAALVRLSNAMDNIGVEAFDRQVAEGQAAGVMNTLEERQRRATASASRSTASSTASRSRSRSNRNEPEELKEQIDLEKELAELRAREQEAEERLLENNQAKGEVAAELAKIEQERLALLEQQTAEAQKQKQLIIEQREAEQERQALMKRATRVQDGITQGLDGIASITKKTIELTEEGGMSAKDAFVTATDEWLKQFAISEAWKGAAAGIEAIGAVIMNAPHAAAKAAEAAGHFALAAAAGGASAAIPNVASAAPADTGASRPEATGGANTGAGSSYVVNFNSPVADSQLGAMQNRASRAAARRFDS